MPSIINATTTTGVSVTGDNSGVLQLATNNGTTAVTISTGQVVTLANALPVASGGTGATTLAGANIPVTSATNTFTAAQRGAVSTLTDGTTITPDFALANNFTVTLGGNRTLANPTNLVAGQSGVIIINQDGTGGRTLAYGTSYDFSGGTAPTLTTTASAQDMIAYIVVSGSRINCVFTGDLK